MSNDQKPKYTYEEIFQRNIGIFTPEEQQKIRNLKVAVVGAGGIGGPVAYNLARLGVGEIRIIDPEEFEVSNLNRQFGCYLDTIGSYKALAVKSEIERISSYLKVKALTENLSESNIDDFLDGVSCVVDGIDFFSLEADVMLHEKARERGLWIFTCQGAKNITSFLSFDPKGYSLKEMVSVNGKPDLKKAIYSMFPQLPDGATPEIIESMVQSAQSTGKHYIPSYSVIAPFNGAFVVEELIKAIIKGQKPVAVAPDFFYFDLETMTSKFYRNGNIDYD